MESFRKAYGALKDSTMVGLAKVNNSQFKELDIAIVKATNHVECPPKERHVRKIFAAILVSSPRADVGYCIYALSKRLEKTRSWIVAIKTLIIFHRILREGDPSFREQLVHFSRRGNVFQASNFKDDSSPLAWDCSAWLRTYALFLEERLECFRKLNYDIEADRVPKSAPRASNARSKIDMSSPQELLEHLPSLQQLLHRLLCCQPEGAGCINFLTQYALALVVKESFKVYCAVNDGIVNLVDMFFEMPKHDAIKALDIYKRAGRQADQLADFYSFCKTLDLAHTFQFPTLRQPPPSFLATMEEYIKEAPQAGSGPHKRQDYRNPREEPQKPEVPEKEVKEVETKKEIVHSQEQPGAKVEDEPLSETKEINPPPVSAQEPVDLLGLNEVNTEATQLEESNALALAIVQPGNDPWPTGNALTEIEKVSGWELALVTAPSNMNKPQVAKTKMGGGFDKALLDSLYEDDVSRRQLQMHRAGYSSCHIYETSPQNLFDQHNPFAMSSSIAPHTSVQMAMMSQPQQFMMQQHQQHNMMTTLPHNPHIGAQYPQQHLPHLWSANPFGDPFTHPHSAVHPNGNHTLL